MTQKPKFLSELMYPSQKQSPVINICYKVIITAVTPFLFYSAFNQQASKQFESSLNSISQV